MDDREKKSIIEGLLFAAGDEGLDVKQLAHVLKLEKDAVCNLVEELKTDFEKQHRGLQIVEVAGAYQLTTRPEHAPYFAELAISPNSASLTQAAMETLAIIAYKQPITRAEIEEIRGVKSERPLRTLMAKQLIKEVGRGDGAGRPILYGTTTKFLAHFGLNHPDDLPPIEKLADPEEVAADHQDLFEKLSAPNAEGTHRA